MAYCMECKQGKQDDEMRTLPTQKKNVIRRCCVDCKERIIKMRKHAKSLAKQIVRTTIGQSSGEI